MAFLSNESLSVKEGQFYSKNAILREFGDQVTSWSFYEDIFDDIDQRVPVIVGAQEHLQAMSISSAIDFAAPRNDTYISGCTYFHDWYAKRTAHDIYAFIIDLDSVWSGGLLNGLRCDWQLTGVPTHYAKPTYIVNSGTGLHLYFVLKEPLPCFKSQLQDIEKLYRAIAVQQSAKAWIGQKPQIQWFGQSFRVVGSLTKDNFETAAFRYGEKWDIQELAKWYGIDRTFRMRGEHEAGAKPLKPRIRLNKRESLGGFVTNRAFYYYTLRTAREKTHEGHRYTAMCALSVIAWKCKIDEVELEKDLNNLLTDFNRGDVAPVKVREIKSAMKMYNGRAMRTPRKRLEDWLGWEYKPIKRNGRKQAEHLERARLVQTLDYPNGTWRNKEGRPSKEQTVREWQLAHPNGNKAACIADTGLSKPTVYKYWKSEAGECIRQ
jgi:hypothetical protein